LSTGFAPKPQTRAAIPAPVARRSAGRCIVGAPRAAEKPVQVLDLDRLRAARLERDPFDFVVVEEFVPAAALPAILADFPAVRGAGSFPIESLKYGVAFAGLVAALKGRNSPGRWPRNLPRTSTAGRRR
jgi:hypothetical protein